jgi:hypothetical protein
MTQNGNICMMTSSGRHLGRHLHRTYGAARNTVSTTTTKMNWSLKDGGRGVGRFSNVYLSVCEQALNLIYAWLSNRTVCIAFLCHAAHVEMSYFDFIQKTLFRWEITINLTYSVLVLVYQWLSGSLYIPYWWYGIVRHCFHSTNIILTAGYNEVDISRKLVGPTV